MEIRRIRSDELERAAALSKDPEEWLRFVRLLREEGQTEDDWIVVAVERDEVLGRIGFRQPRSRPGEFHLWGFALPESRTVLPVLDGVLREIEGEGGRQVECQDRTEGPGDRGDVLRAAGFRVLQEKRRFVRDAAEAPPLPSPSPRLAFRPLAEAGEEAFVHAIARVSVDTLDRQDRFDFGEDGYEVGARKYYDLLVEIDHRPEWWKLAFDDAGDLVGLIVPQRFNKEVGALNYVGVVPGKRGRGHGEELLAEGTRVLEAAGVQRIIGEIDAENLPLAAALPRLGYREKYGFRIWRREIG
jgi:RimJ/RimL family protein N-acetyltransferase